MPRRAKSHNVIAVTPQTQTADPAPEPRLIRNNNTDRASEARRRIGDEKAAARLRRRGWLPVPPDRLAELPAEIVRELTSDTNVAG